MGFIRNLESGGGGLSPSENIELNETVSAIFNADENSDTFIQGLSSSNLRLQAHGAANMDLTAFGTEFYKSIDVNSQGLFLGGNGALLDGGRSVSSNLSGATATTSITIPANSLLLMAAAEIITPLGTTNGTTGYQLGDGSTADEFGSHTGTANAEMAIKGSYYPVVIASDTTIVITATGGNFDGTGAIDVIAMWARIN